MLLEIFGENIKHISTALFVFELLQNQKIV